MASGKDLMLKLGEKPILTNESLQDIEPYKPVDNGIYKFSDVSKGMDTTFETTKQEIKDIADDFNFNGVLKLK